MNQYRNYGNYGNNMRMMQGRGNGKPEKDCGCGKPEMKYESDCGCMKESVMAAMDCGCMKKDEVKEKNCGCKENDDDRYDRDCECMMKSEYKEQDCGCHTEQCGCAVETMYREMKQGGMCCESDMPGKALAMAYVPWQRWGKLYEICEGFATGTIFKELNLEFYGRRCS